MRLPADKVCITDLKKDKPKELWCIYHQLINSIHFSLINKMINFNKIVDVKVRER